MSMKHVNTAFAIAVLMIAMLSAGMAQKSTFPKAQYQIQGNGIPAKPGRISYQQPDGTIINIELKGDAAIHWAVSDDGYTLLSNANGYYEYAKLDANANLVSTGMVAKNAASRKSAEVAVLNTISKGINYSEKQIKQKLINYKSTQKKDVQASSFQAIGTQKFIVLLVQFSDVSFTNTVSDIDNLMNQPNYNGTGSFKDFHTINSNGKLTVNTTVSGIFTASNTHSYYGQNDGGGSDMNVTELVAEAIAAADPSIDFSQYDNNSDGVVDAVYVIYAGTGEASSGNPSDIWPHNNPGITPITVDGVVINAYTCSNELNGTSLVGIGTICHEFGHAIGLPDFYDTDYAGSGGQAEGTGSWDVMASGNSNNNEASPANHNPVSKEFLGWQTPQVITSNGPQVLVPATQDTIAFLINSITANESFYLQNRQLEGFDSGLQGHGMLIFHCDYAYFDQTHLTNNDINVNPSHQGFDLEEADGENTNEAGDTYPGTTSNTSFTDLTTPSSVLWTGSNFEFPIVDIVENGTTNNIEFNISGFTGINDMVSNRQVVVSPTLANDFININSSEMIQHVSLINLQGQVVFQNNVGNQQTRLNVSNIASGTYFVKTKTASHTVVSKVVIGQ
jgi:M6 family metalloprotease-like protein